MRRTGTLLGLGTILGLIMLIAAACGGDDATATPSATAPPQIVEVTREVEVTKEVTVVETVEVTKEVQVPVEVTKEVVVTQEVEVTTEVVVTREVVVTPTPQPTATAVPPPTPSGEPVVSRLKVGTFFPIENNDPSNLRDDLPQLSPMYEALVRYGFTSLPEPMLASSWEVNPDASVWTFNLERGVQFHQGFGEMTADDVIHTIERYAREGVETSQSDFFRTNLVSTETPDDYTVILNLDAGRIDLADSLLHNKRTMIQSKAQFDATGQEGLEAGPAGTGPYQMVSREQSVNILYETVPYEHWRVTPDFPELEYVYINENATSLAALLAGEIHMARLPGDLEATAVDRGMRVIEAGDPTVALYTLLGGGIWKDDCPYGKIRKCEFPDLPDSDVAHDVTELPWVDIRVREAMNIAIDRDEIQQVLLNGRGIPMYVLNFHPGVRGFNPEWEAIHEEKYGYDPDRARALLAEVEAEIGQPLDFSNTIHALTAKPQFAGLVDLGLTIDSFWRAVGIEVPTEIRDFAAQLPHVFNGTTGGSAWTNSSEKFSDPFHLFLFYYSKAGPCCAFIEDDEVDALYEQAAPMNDLVQRDLVLRQAGDILYNNYVSVPLFWLPSTFTVNPNIVDDYRTSGQLGYGDLEDVVAVKN